MYTEALLAIFSRQIDWLISMHKVGNENRPPRSAKEQRTTKSIKEVTIVSHECGNNNANTSSMLILLAHQNLLCQPKLNLKTSN